MAHEFRSFLSERVRSTVDGGSYAEAGKEKQEAAMNQGSTGLPIIRGVHYSGFDSSVGRSLARFQLSNFSTSSLEQAITRP
jgi:hypothetical protein